jgi:D-glycero-alpha-D-manno-heptose-7-phosphate kinase
MIISRTPFRVSFFGGGTDYPVWYNDNGGAVINVTINKYSFITARVLPPFFDYKHRIRYYEREEVNDIDKITHPSVRECMKFTNIEQGLEIVHHADLPALSGLGSSSTFTVGLLNALYALKGYMPTKKELANNAIHVEQDLIKESVGSQDQTAAAFGGLNRIDFGGRENVVVQPLILTKERLDEFQNNLMLFFTGFSRTASEIASSQIKETPSKTKELNTMMELLEEAYAIIRDEKMPLDNFGCLLNTQWKVKRAITRKITNHSIDEIYDTGIQAGALGGKLLGAGGGGFMLFYVRPEMQEAVRQALQHLLYVPFRFDFTGSQIIYYSHDDNL